jgi:hypothetical protein
VELLPFAEAEAEAVYRVARTPGWAALAFPFLPPPECEFDEQEAAATLVLALRAFLARCRHTELRLYLVDTTGRARNIPALRQIAATDSRFVILESDSLVELGTLGTPARVIACPTNWQFSAKKGSSTNRSINAAAGGKLEAYCTRHFEGGAAVGSAYAAPVAECSSLYDQHARFVIQVSSPNMKVGWPACLNGDYDLGVKKLRECYTHMFEMFFALTFPFDASAAFVAHFSAAHQLPLPSRASSIRATATPAATSNGATALPTPPSVIEVEAMGPLNGRIDVKRKIAIASFDMDSTLIKNLKGGEWQYLYGAGADSTIRVVQALAERGFQIVIFTNQAPAGKSWAARTKARAKIVLVAKGLRVPVLAFGACNFDQFRLTFNLMFNIICFYTINNIFCHW